MAQWLQDGRGREGESAPIRCSCGHGPSLANGLAMWSGPGQKGLETGAKKVWGEARRWTHRESRSVKILAPRANAG